MGQARRRTLQALAETLAATSESAWVPTEVAPSDASLTLTRRRDGLRLLLAFAKVHSPNAFARLDTTSVSYRCEGVLDGAARDDLTAWMRTLRQLEATDSGHFHPLLERGVAELTMLGTLGRLELRPTLACNHRCGFCNSVDWETTDNVVTGRKGIVAQLDSVSHQPATTLAITGGEPTLLPDLAGVIADAADRGYRVELQTNGMALDDASYARRLKDAGLETVLVSLHSRHSSLSDETITGFAGGWARTLSGIDNALSVGLGVDISHVLHSDNYTETAEFLRFVAQSFGRRVAIRLAFVAPTGGARQRIERFVPPLTDVIPHLSAGLAEARRLRLRLTLVSYCGVPPCLIAPYDDFSEVSSSTDVSFTADHVKLAACTGCRYETSCPGLWQRYYERYGDPGLRALPRRRLEALRRFWDRYFD